ncbi:hypothetical protein FRX31_013642, partial [Thalictrum thalictroides]
LSADSKRLQGLSDFDLRKLQMKSLAQVKDVTTEIAIRDEAHISESRRMKEQITTLQKEKLLLKASLDVELRDQLQKKIIDLELKLCLEVENSKKDREHLEASEVKLKKEISDLKESETKFSETISFQLKEIADLKDSKTKSSGTISS